ncbi:spore coat protein SP65 isoform X2 [Hydra vulgaris]|uniref:Spore coat protein SP65 isoform X2 n=1 Tax=Hydra vulgaris TaxID=6087 RepID=A0ABM4B7D3_HYDVU
MILICVLILSLKLIGIAPQGLVADYSNQEETCKNLEDGRHCVRDCFAFMVCNNGSKTVMTCPPNELYHNGVKKCVPSYQVTKDNFCFDRPDGPYRNPWDCAKFIQCIKGWTHEEQCEDGLRYDASSNSCNNASYSRYCYILGNSGVNNTINTLNSHSISKIQFPTVSNIKERNFCLYRPNGLYRNPWDCHSFIKCLKGITEIEICPAGLTYIAEHNTCENDTFVQHCHVIVSDNAVLSTTSVPIIRTTQSPITTTSTAIPVTTSTTITAATSTTTIATTLTTTTTTPTTTTITPTTTTTTPTTTTTTPTTTTTTTTTTITTTPVVDYVDLITPEELLIKLQASEIPLIDVREPWEIRLEGRIAHSVNIPVSQIDKALKLSPEEFRFVYHYNKPLQNDCRIVFHCKSGVRSAHALSIAKQNGYKCAKSLKGGFTAWKALYP